MQGDGEIQRQEGRSVLVCLRSPHLRDAVGRQAGVWAWRIVPKGRSRDVAAAAAAIARRFGGVYQMGVGWYFIDVERVRFFATARPELMPVADMHRHAASEVRQGKSSLPISTKGSPQQREECLVLIDRQKLSVALCPAFGGEAKGQDADF